MEIPLFSLRDAPEAAIGWIRRFTTDDLHAFCSHVLGWESELPLIDAVLAHPAVDRATALNLFGTCSPVATEEAWKSDGLDLSEPDTRVFVEVLDRAHARLLRPFASTRLRDGHSSDWLRFPNRSPLHLTRWRIPAEVLRNPGTESPRPRIRRYDTSVVALSDPTSW